MDAGLYELDGTPVDAVPPRPSSPRSASLRQLPPLGWPFVALAAVELLLAGIYLLEPGRAFGSSPAGAVIFASAVLAAEATLLLPAALLLRRPTAWQEAPLLVAGVLISTIGAVSSVGLQAAYLTSGPSSGFQANQAYDLLALAGQVGGLVGLASPFLVAAGIGRLGGVRLRRPPLPGLLGVAGVAVAGIAVNLGLVGSWPAEGNLPGLDWLSAIGAATVTPLGAGLLGWVAAVALGDRIPTRRFWALVLATSVVSLVYAAAVDVYEVWSSLAPGIGSIELIALLTVAGCLPAVLELVAFGRYLPEAAEPAGRQGDGSGPGARAATVSSLQTD